MSQQQSSKHGPTIDDALQDERRQSSAGTRHMGRPENDPVGGTTTDDLRIEVARFLGPSAFPGSRAHLLAVAKDNNATEEVQRLLERLPDGTYQSTQEVLDAFS